MTVEDPNRRIDHVFVAPVVGVEVRHRSQDPRLRHLPFLAGLSVPKESG